MIYRQLLVQEDGIGTQSDQPESMLIKSIRRYSSTGAARINSGHGTKKLQEDWMGTKDIGYYFIKSLWVYLSLVPQDVHGTRIARGVPSTSFILI